MKQKRTKDVWLRGDPEVIAGRAESAEQAYKRMARGEFKNDAERKWWKRKFG